MVLTQVSTNNTELLDVEQVNRKLLSLRYVHDEIAGYGGVGRAILAYDTTA